MSTVQPLSPAAIQAIEASAYHLFISKYYALASTAMLVYDTILTFDREVEAVWHSRWSGVKMLFFFNRYANIIAYLAALVAINSTWPASVCKRYVLFPGIFNMFQQVVIAAILILFTFALFNRSRTVLVIVGTTLIAQLVVTGWSLGVVTSVPLPPGFVGCIYAGKKGTGIRVTTAWIMQLVFISVVFGLMIWKALRLRRVQVRAPLITIMTRDGLKYFGVIFSANFVNVMNFALVKDSSLRSIHATFSALITVIMINRLILSVREEARRPFHNISGTQLPQSTFLAEMTYDSTETATTTTLHSMARPRVTAVPLGSGGTIEYTHHGYHSHTPHSESFEMPRRSTKS